MRLSDYLDHYEREDLHGALYAIFAGLITLVVFITLLEMGREMIAVSGVIQ